MTLLDAVACREAIRAPERQDNAADRDARAVDEGEAQCQWLAREEEALGERRRPIERVFGWPEGPTPRRTHRHEERLEDRCSERTNNMNVLLSVCPDRAIRFLQTHNNEREEDRGKNNKSLASRRGYGNLPVTWL